MPLPNGDPSAADVVALANRLLAQKNAAGWYDLVSICERLKTAAHQQVQDYKGSDRDELFDLVRRSQIADSFIVQFFGYIDWAISQAQGLPGFQREDPRPSMITTKIPGSY